MYKGYTFTTFLPAVIIALFFTSAIQVWRFIVVWICVSLMTNDVEDLSYTYWLVAYLLWRNVYSTPHIIKLEVIYCPLDTIPSSNI